MENIKQLASQIFSCIPSELLFNNKLDMVVKEAWSANGQSSIEFTFLIADAVGIANLERIAPLATAIHSSYIAARVFDDVIDQDKADSVASKYGTPVGVNLGLFLLTFSSFKLTEFCDKSMLPPEQSLRLLECLHKNSFFAAGGQYYDFALAKDFVTEENYIQRVNLKSGKLMSAIFTLIALASECSSQSQIDRFSRVGQVYGLFDQLVNDLRSCTTGELERNSLIQGIITLPVLYTLSNLNEPLLTEFCGLWSKTHKTKADTLRMSALLEESGAFALTGMKLSQIFNELQNLLDVTNNSAEARLFEVIKQAYFGIISLNLSKQNVGIE